MRRRDTPLPFSPADEQPERHEAERAADLRALMHRVRAAQHHRSGHAQRSLHAKSHALLEGEMEVLRGLPPALAQGLFARPGRYPVVMRLSTNRGDILDDAIGVPRGMAIKVIGVPRGERRLPGSEGERTQDFVLVNQPFFTEPDLKTFRRNIAVVYATTEAGQGWKKAVAAALRPFVALGRGLGSWMATPGTMGGHPATNPLGDTFFSQVPFRHGEHVAKYALVPVCPELRALKNRGLPKDRPNAIREACIAHFARRGGVWELRAQLRTNPRTMPVENARTEWPEDESPYLAVARIAAPPQPAWSEARAREVDDALAFSPWNGLEAHRPLGAINRARLLAYKEGAAFRARVNRCPIHEPNAAVALDRGRAEAFGAPEREGSRAVENGRDIARDGRRPAALGPFGALGLACAALWLATQPRPTTVLHRARGRGISPPSFD